MNILLRVERAVCPPEDKNWFRVKDHDIWIYDFNDLVTLPEAINMLDLIIGSVRGYIYLHLSCDKDEFKTINIGFCEFEIFSRNRVSLEMILV